MQPRKIFIFLITLVGVLVISYFTWPFAFTVVPIAQMEQRKIEEAFDPVKYVDDIWDSKILPTIDEKAVNLADILKEIKLNEQGFAAKDNLIKVAEKYGLITIGEAHVYIVESEAEVVSVDTSTSVGMMEVHPSDYDGPIKVLVYVGPRIPADETSVRDSVGFINFGDFKDQTEYSRVATEINKRILARLSSLDKESLVGKTIFLRGAMTIRTFNLVNIDLRQVKIVPVTIEVKE